QLGSLLKLVVDFTERRKRAMLVPRRVAPQGRGKLPAFADEFLLSLCQAGKAYAMKLPETPSGEATSCH
ncbi:hypothetical protein, partial [Klebsiella pneumoniae]|uniref:hypothetical protein n=1 Tax=Klebsiella pneumoniae TaxID=573 RepID=UPI001C6258CD